MALTAKQKAFADIIIDDEIGHLIKSKRPSSSAIRAAKKACKDEAFAYDKNARGKERGYARSWSTATADEVAKAIEKVMRSTVKDIYKKVKKSADASDVMPDALKNNVTSLGSLFAVPAAAAATKQENVAPMMTRRNAMFGLGALFGATVLGTGTAFALNRTYIDSVKEDAKTYVSKTKGREVERALGAGGRADAADYIPEILKRHSA